MACTYLLIDQEFDFRSSLDLFYVVTLSKSGRLIAQDFQCYATICLPLMHDKYTDENPAERDGESARITAVYGVPMYSVYTNRIGLFRTEKRIDQVKGCQEYIVFTSCFGQVISVTDNWVY